MQKHFKAKYDTGIQNKTMISCLRILCTLVLFTSHFSIAQVSDSLQRLLKNKLHDTTRCNILGLLIDDENDPAIWEVYNQEIESISSRNLAALQNESNLYKVFQKHFASAISNKGVLEFSRGKDLEALKDFETALKIESELENKRGISSAVNNIGAVHNRLGNITKAFEYFKRSLILCEELNDSLGISQSYNNMGIIYQGQGQLDLALEYYQKAYHLHMLLHDEYSSAAAFNNIGYIFKAKKKYDSALIFYKKALQINLSYNDLEGVSSAYNNLGRLYDETGDYDSAINYLNKTLKIDEEFDNVVGMADAYNNIASVYIKKKDLARALEFAKVGLSFAQKSRALESIGQSASQLKDIYKSLGRPAQALEMMELYISMKDSVTNRELRDMTLKSQYQYEFDKKEAVLKEQQEKERLLAEAKEQRQTLISWSIGAGLLLVAFFLLFSIYRLSIIKRQKVLIEQQKLKTEEQKQAIETKNKENELLLSEIHHRVKNNLQVISSLLSLQERSMETGSARSAILEGKERVKSMELVHKLLYQKGSFSGIEMQNYVRELIHGLFESFGMDSKSSKLDISINPITLDVDTAIPLGLILNELVVNTLKYAKNESEKLVLKISIRENSNKELEVQISDNGKGKISDVEKSNSFGLKIVRALARQLNGLMNIKDENGLSYLFAFKNYKIINYGN